MSRGRVRLFRGPRDAESWLLSRVEEHVQQARIDPTLLAERVVICVPSASLREHLICQLVRACGSALIGIQVVSLFELAKAVATKQGDEGGKLLGGVFELLVARAARREPELGSYVEQIERAEEAIVSSCRDFLSAGLDDDTLEAVCEALQGISMAASIARVSVSARRELLALGLERSGDCYQRAADVVLDSGGLVGARAVYVHGFADATGQALQLIAALLARGADVLVDLPPDPAHVAGSSRPQRLETRFPAQFVERLGESEKRPLDRSSAGVELSIFNASGIEAEVREVAFRVLALLQAGTLPERIGIIARDLSSYAVPLRQELTRRGVPFSGGAAPRLLFAAQRRLKAALRLIDRGELAAIETWIEALAPDVLASAVLEPATIDANDDENAEVPAWHENAEVPAWHENAEVPAWHENAEVPAWHENAEVPAWHENAEVPAWHENAEVPAWHENAEVPAWHENAEVPAWHENAEVPAWHENAEVPAWHENAEVPAWHENAEVPAWHENAEVPAWHENAEVQQASSRSEVVLGDDLRLVCRSLGLARLQQAARLDLEALRAKQPLGIPLPLRGFVEVEATEEAADDESPQFLDEEGTPALRRPYFSHRVFAAAIERLRATLSLLACWPEVTTLREHTERTLELFSTLLGWGASSVTFGDWQADLTRAVAAGRQADLRLDRAEFRQLLSGWSVDWGVEDLGGRGAGVLVLDALHARGVVFEQLFVLGVNRGVFPRAVHDDPLLSDRARFAVRAVLADMPLKQLGHHEERYLLAHFCDAAPRVTLSWLRADVDGRQRLISPLLERIRTAQPQLDELHLPRLWQKALSAPLAGGPTRPRTVRERAVLHGLVGRGRSAGLWQSVYRRGLQQLPTMTHECSVELARARLRVLDEQDPDLSSREGQARARMPGPYLGLIGGPVMSIVKQGKAVVDAGPLFITRAEDLARCPWQAFLKNLLGVEATPDPLANLPRLTGLHLGNAVHLALQSLVGKRALMACPDDETVRAAVDEAIAAVAEREGILLAGLRKALGQMTLPRVRRALQLDWPHPRATVPVAGGEQTRSVVVCDLEGQQKRIAFKADRIDERGERLLLTDYKTGRPLSLGKRPKTRVEQLRRQIASGQRLQVACYAASSEEAVGRYLFLDPDIEADIAVAQIGSDDPSVRQVLPRVLGLLLSCLQQGVFFPRLEDARGAELRACRSCELAEACFRGDSGVRRRLAYSLVQRSEAQLSLGPQASQASLAKQLFHLGQKESITTAGYARELVTPEAGQARKSIT
jgi:hypothetical protein